MTDAVRTLKEWTDAARKIVFFGGAGVSTESGIPDSVDTPAPPKKTIFRAASVHSFNVLTASVIKIPLQSV